MYKWQHKKCLPIIYTLEFLNDKIIYSPGYNVVIVLLQ
jgi:hypothetical protein